MRNLTRVLLRKLAEIHHDIKQEEAQSDGQEGVHFALKVSLLTPAANRVYHERLLELVAPPMNSVAMALIPPTAPPPTPAVDAKQIIAAVKAKKKLSPAQVKQRRDAAKKKRK